MAAMDPSERFSDSLSAFEEGSLLVFSEPALGLFAFVCDDVGDDVGDGVGKGVGDGVGDGVGEEVGASVASSMVLVRYPFQSELDELIC